MVISDFDPLADEEKLAIYYKTLTTQSLYKTYFKRFSVYYNAEQSEKNIDSVLEVENGFENFIRSEKEESKKLKETTNQYFKILNLIEFVIDLDKKYSKEDFKDFWRRFAKLYRILNPPTDIIDDVGIYFDNRIGITSPSELAGNSKPKKAKVEVNGESHKYKYNILEVIAKRNQEEEDIAKLIEEFEEKITAFFESILIDATGKRLIAKMKDENNSFSQDEIYYDFSKIYRKYTIKNKELGIFFIKETRHILNQLCDDFENFLKEES